MAVTKFQRVYEAAIFKTLGASSRAVAAMLMVEYGLLGTLAGAVGSFGALALGWGVSRYALDIPWRPALHENFIGTAATSLLIMIIGVAVQRGCASAQAACGVAGRVAKMMDCQWTPHPSKRCCSANGETSSPAAAAIL